MVRRNNQPTSSELLTLITIVLVVMALYFGRAILIPLALAVVFTFLLEPLITWLERSFLGRVSSVLLVLALAFATIGILGWVVTHQFVQITGQLPSYMGNLQQKIKLIHGFRDGSFSKANASMQQLNKELAAASADAPATPTPGQSQTKKGSGPAPAVRPIPVQVTEPPQTTFQSLGSLLGPLVKPIETAGIVIVFSVFMLLKREDLRNRLISLAGQGRLNVMTQAMDDAAQRLSRYLLLQSVINAGFGLLFGTGLYLIGIPHSLLWGVLGGLLRFIPYLGTLIAAVFPVTMALAVFPGWSQALLALGFFLVLELTVSNFVEPWLCGAHTGISSLAFLVAAAFWFMLWGPVGLLLSTPLTVCLVVLGRYVPQLRFLEVVLGDEPVLSAEEHFYQRLLAMDQEEAIDIAKAYLKVNSLESLYESVLIPALNLAEEDRHRDALDEEQEKFICQSTKELIEELGERIEQKPPAEGSNGERFPETGPSCSIDTTMPSIVCLPARDEADEIVGLMVTQLLQRTGYRAHSVEIGAASDMLQQVSQHDTQLACVSALPPFAMGQARALCKRLRAQFPEITIILGLWNVAGGVARAQERFGSGCADIIVTTPAEAMLQIRHLTQSLSRDMEAQDVTPSENEEHKKEERRI